MFPPQHLCSSAWRYAIFSQQRWNTAVRFPSGSLNIRLHLTLEAGGERRNRLGQPNAWRSRSEQHGVPRKRERGLAANVPTGTPFLLRIRPNKLSSAEFPLVSHGIKTQSNPAAHSQHFLPEGKNTCEIKPHTHPALNWPKYQTKVPTPHFPTVLVFFLPDCSSAK